jgi:hypothetical protein
MRLAVKHIIALVIIFSANTSESSVKRIALNDPTTNKVSFVAIGDMPYKKQEISMLTAPNGDIVKAIRKFNPDVLVHFGDIKAGGVPCTDELLIRRREQLFNLLPFKTVFAPGDNDWTDCDRKSLTPRFNELERLNFLRTHYFSGDGNKLTRDVTNLTRQPQFIENATWAINNLIFGTINVPGTNNGRVSIELGNVNEVLDEADRRDAFNEAWVNQLFEQASNANGLVITFQADLYQPSRKKYPVKCSVEKRSQCDGYMKIREQIEQKSAESNKPVLIIHGDTNAYCFHQPMVKQASNFWRLNGLGDYSLSDAAQITFDPENIKMPFKVVSLLGQQSLPTVCEYRD